MASRPRLREKGPSAPSRGENRRSNTRRLSPTVLRRTKRRRAPKLLHVGRLIADPGLKGRRVAWTIQVWKGGPHRARAASTPVNRGVEGGRTLPTALPPRDGS